MKTNTLNKLLPVAVCAFAAFGSQSKAALAADLGVTFGAILSDFQVADANLQSDTAVNGVTNAVAFTGGSFTSANINTSSGATVITATHTGTATNTFTTTAGHTAGDPILPSNVFTIGGTIGVDFTGLAALDAGSIITVTAYGIGDNLNQDSSFAAVFGSDIQNADTVFNTVADRNDATGTVPFAQFTFTADGITDLIDLDVTAGPGGQNRSHFNGYSISVVPVTIPEPSSLMLLGLSGGFLLTRRRRA